MTYMKFLTIEIWLIVGLLYVLINVFLRKLETDDPMLVLVWLFLWPLGILSLIVLGIIHLIQKIQNIIKRKYRGLQRNNDNNIIKSNHMP